MSTERNKSVVRRFIDEVFVEGRPESVDELVAPAFRPHTWPTVEPGTESLKAMMATMAGRLSDVRMSVEDVIAEGDRVAVLLTSHAVPRGDFMGVHAAGKEYTIPEIHIFRVEDGRIAEHWHVADMLGMMRQLGAIREPATAG